LPSSSGSFAGSLVVLFAGILLQLLEPWPLKFVLDRIIPTEPSEGLLDVPVLDRLTPTALLTSAALVYVLIVILRAICDYYNSLGFALIGNRVTGELRSDLYRHIQKLSMSFHTKSRTGDLLVRVIGDIKLLRDVAVTAIDAGRNGVGDVRGQLATRAAGCHNRPGVQPVNDSPRSPHS
jgi:ATP-binding cassette subfamily B protein